MLAQRGDLLAELGLELGRHRLHVLDAGGRQRFVALGQGLHDGLALGGHLRLHRAQQRLHAVEPLEQGVGDIGARGGTGSRRRIDGQTLRGIAARLVAPALHRRRVGRRPHQERGAGGLAAEAEHRTQQVGNGGRCLALAGEGSRAAQDLLHLHGRARSAVGMRGRHRGDGDGRLLAHLARADAELLHQLGRGLHPRHGVQQMVEAHLGGTMEQGGVVGTVAAGLDLVVDVDRLQRAAGRMRPGPAVGVAVVDAGLTSRPRAARPQIQVHTFVGHALALPTLSPSALVSKQECTTTAPGAGHRRPSVRSRANKTGKPWLVENKRRRAAAGGRFVNGLNQLASTGDSGLGYLCAHDRSATFARPFRRPWRAQPWPRSGVSAIVFRAREVLLVERASGALKGRWSPPGGHIEAGERARDAAVREVREETGVDGRDRRAGRPARGDPAGRRGPAVGALPAGGVLGPLAGRGASCGE